MNKPERSIKSCDGFSLVEVLIAAGILGIIGLGMTSMLATQIKESRALTEKMAAMTAQRQLLLLLSNNAICTRYLTKGFQDPATGEKHSHPFEFNTTTILKTQKKSDDTVISKPTGSTTKGRLPDDLFESATPSTNPDNEPRGFQANYAPIPEAPSLKVEAIYLENIRPVGTSDQFRGEVAVHWQNEKLVRPLKPISVPIYFSTDPSSPTNAKVVDGCNDNNQDEGAGARLEFSCPDGKYVVGFEKGEVLCSTFAVPTPAPGGCAADESPCNTSGTLSYDYTKNRVIECNGTCWKTKNLAKFCTPPEWITQADDLDDSGMWFKQTDTDRRIYGSPCESVQIKKKKGNTNLQPNGLSIKFGSATRSCSNNTNCVERAP